MKSSSTNLFLHLLRQKLNFGFGLVIALSAISPSAWADQTKANNTTALNVGGSWVSGNVPGSGDRAIWDSTITGANVSALGGAMTWEGIQILNPGGSITIGTGDSQNLTLGTSGIDMSSATENLTINLGSGNQLQMAGSQTWNVASNLTLYAAGSSGSSRYGFSSGSNPTLTLVGGGTVQLGNENNNGGSGGTVIVSSNVTLQAAAHQITQNINALTVNSGGVFDANGIGLDSGSINVNLNGTGINGNGAMINSSSTKSEMSGPAVNLQSSSSIGGNAGIIQLDKTIATSTGAFSLTKVGSDTLSISSASYTGATIINAGTLQFRGGGYSLNAASTVSIAAGATFNTTSLSSGNWTAGSTASPGLIASGTGTTAGTTEALINSGGTVNLGTRPVTLNWGGATSGTDTTHPCLVVVGALTLGGNAFTINGAQLSAGTYTLIQVGNGSSGTLNYTAGSIAGGTAVASGSFTYALSAGSGNLILTVTASATPNIVVSDDGTQVGVGNIYSGNTNVLLLQAQLADTVSGATLTGVSFTTGGTATSADLADFKVWYQPTGTFNLGAATLLGTITSSLGAGSHSLSSLSQNISSGTNGYIFITGDVTATPTGGDTVNVAPLTPSSFTFLVAPTISGSTSTGGTQTVQLPSVTLGNDNPQVAAASAAAGSVNVRLLQAQLAVSAAPATLTGVSFSTVGSYVASDITDFKVWYQTSATFNAGTATLLGTITSSLGAGSQSLSALSQNINSGTTGYIFITCDVAAAPTSGDTISVSAVNSGNVTVAVGAVSGSTSAGGAQTFQTVDHFAISTISSPQTAGSPITGITITAQNSANNTVTSFAGTVTYGGTAGITGTSGTFSAGVLSGVSVTPTVAGGSQTFTVTLTGGSPTGTANTFTVQPGPMTQLVMNPTTISSATAGTDTSGSFTSITAEDAYGNTSSSGPNAFTNTVTFGGTAGATNTSAPFTAGVLSTFPTLIPTLAGTNETITATSGSVVGTTTIATVNSGTPAILAVTVQPSPVAQTNVVFGQQPQVTVEDAYGNVVPEAGVTIAVTENSSDNLSGLGTIYQNTGVNGTAVFSGLFITNAGTFTLNFSANGLASTNSANIVVTEGPPPYYKVNNTNALNLPTSWSTSTGGVGTPAGPPDASSIAIWDSTVTGPNNPALGATMSWAGIQILNPGGLVTIGTNDNNSLHLTSTGTAIDMSAATADLTFNLQAGNGRVYIDASQTWDVASGRTLTLGNAGLSGGSSSKYGFNANNLTLTLTGGGTVVLGQNDGSGGGIIVVSTNTTMQAGNHAYSQNLSTININTGGVFDLNGVNSDSASPTINLNGTGINGNGAVINSSSTQARVNGPQFNLQTDSTIDCLNGNIDVDKSITGSANLTISGTNTLLLNYNGTEALTGNYIISSGTLGFAQGGVLLNPSSTVSIAAGATFDVHDLNGSGSWTDGSAASPGLIASGTGTNAGSNEALIISQSGGTVSLTEPITLNWGGATSGTDTTNPCLVVSPGQLTLNNNPITINGATLGNGTYTLISVTGGTINGSPNPTPTGTAISGSATNVISVSGSSVILTVTGGNQNPFPPGPTPPVTVSNNTATVTFAGVPGYSYSILRSTNLLSGTWVTLETTNAPAGGLFSYTDTFGDLGVPPAPAPSAAFYVLRWNP